MWTQKSNRSWVNRERKKMSEMEQQVEQETVQEPETVTLSKAELDHMISEKSRMAYQAAEQKVKKRYETERSAMQSQMGQQGSAIDWDEIDRRVEEKLSSRDQYADMRRHVDDAVRKFQMTLSKAQEKYPEISNSFESFDIQSKPELVDLINSVDNGEDVLNELIRNRHRAVIIAQTARSGMVKDAAAMMKDLSLSIKKNKDAQEHIKTPNEPLSKIKSSYNSSEAPAMTVAQARKMFKGNWKR